ncbi:hypothetical protein ACNHYB_02480 [Isoptericola jiangsuensis]|uniref:hypothetical protein n=1 Tax=Isoptericola jiangsuensis TaxID=548579 RepID=UPI003AB00EDC
MNLLLETLDAVWRVTLGGLVLGVGAPVVFAAGMAALGIGRTVSDDGEAYATPATPTGRVVAGLCFAVVAALVVGGVVLIVAGG